IPNRVRALPPCESAGSGVEVPRDALVPDPATGLLRPPASAASAQQKVTYRVMLSKFHDGTKMTVADIVYPFAFAYRWSARDPERDAGVKRTLAVLLDGLERVAFIPEALRGVVTVEQARLRWAALRRFYHARGHFLVSSGPYQLVKWSADSVVLGVFRDLSYP